MNVLERLNSQINQSLIKRQPIIEYNEPVKKDLPKPLSLDILRKVLEENMETQEVPILETILEPIDLNFDGIEAFVAWYEIRKEKFTEGQNIALSTLVQMRDMINNGCGCKRHVRLGSATDYFRTFWQQNSVTDMPKKVMEAGNGKSLVIRIGQENLINI